MQLVQLAVFQNLPPGELDALEELYYATDDAEWPWHWHNTSGAGARRNFTRNPNPCLDSCSTPVPLYRIIFLLRLSAYDFHGTIPESIGSFSQLEYSSLDVNRIPGAIPPV